MATKRGLPTTREELVLMLINRKQPQSVDSDLNCTYSHNFNGGCAIGVALTKKVAEFLQQGDQFISIGEVLLKAPKRLSSMGVDFLSDLQSVHDSDRFWWDCEEGEIGRNGLVWNKKGVKNINKLILNHNLKLEKIELVE